MSHLASSAHACVCVRFTAPPHFCGFDLDFLFCFMDVLSLNIGNMHTIEIIYYPCHFLLLVRCIFMYLVIALVQFAKTDIGMHQILLLKTTHDKIVCMVFVSSSWAACLTFYGQSVFTSQMRKKPNRVQ